MISGPRKTTYMDISEINVSEHNPKEHDVGAIHESISEHGYIENLTWDERRSCLISGHGRLKTLLQQMARGEDPPEGIVAQNGTWFVPVTRGWASQDDAGHDKAIMSLNRTVELGGWNESILSERLKAVDESVDKSGDKLVESLRGSGFDKDDADQLQKRLREPEPRSNVEIDCPRCLGTGKIKLKGKKEPKDA